MSEKEKDSSNESAVRPNALRIFCGGFHVSNQAYAEHIIACMVCLLLLITSHILNLNFKHQADSNLSFKALI